MSIWRRFLKEIWFYFHFTSREWQYFTKDIFPISHHECQNLSISWKNAFSTNLGLSISCTLSYCGVCDLMLDKNLCTKKRNEKLFHHRCVNKKKSVCVWKFCAGGRNFLWPFYVRSGWKKGHEYCVSVVKFIFIKFITFHIILKFISFFLASLRHEWEASEWMNERRWKKLFIIVYWLLGTNFSFVWILHEILCWWIFVKLWSWCKFA
jgi:hypothetical protein